MADDHKKKGHDDHGGGKSHKKHAKHGGGGHGGEEHGEGAPEWLISFADNVMLQMGFFVILLALNMGPKGSSDAAPGEPARQNNDFIDFAIGVRAAFNNPVDINSSDANDAPLVKRLKEKAAQSNEPGRDGKKDKVESMRDTGFSSLGGAVTFVDGSASLSDTERAAAVQIAEGIKGLRWVVDVRGHVSQAEAVRDERAAWKLSYDRAFTVATTLVEAGLDWKQIRIVAAGPNDPVSATESRTYDLGKLRQNQRVEIAVTNQQAGEME